MTVCLICKDSKQLPSSCLERLCCSSSIKNEFLIKLSCCEQYVHPSCLNTYILSKRDLEVDKNNIKDKCLHCKKKLEASLSRNVIWNSIKEYDEYRSSELSSITPNQAWSNIFTCYILSLLAVIILGSLSTVLYYTVAIPNYVSLCTDSNLTISYKSNFTLTKKYLCERCFADGATTNSSMQHIDIECPPNNVAYFVNPVVNWAFIFVVMLLIGIMTYYAYDNNFLELFYNVKKYPNKPYRVICLWFGIFGILNVVRFVCIITYYTLILEPEKRIKKFDEIYILQAKNLLMDLGPIAISYLPIIFLTLRAIVVWGILPCFSECFPSDCCQRMFHSSHYEIMNEIEPLKPNQNTNNLKKYMSVSINNDFV
jgi:hypothetical protein